MTYLERLKAELAHAEANNVTGTIWDSDTETIIRRGPTPKSGTVYIVTSKPNAEKPNEETTSYPGTAELLAGRAE